MSKMFKCSDGTMFPVNGVLSIEEATDYYNDRGELVRPIIFTDEQKLKESLACARVSRSRPLGKTVYRGEYNEFFYVKFFRRLSVWLRGGDVRKSDQEVEEKAQRAYEEALRESERVLEENQRAYENEVASISIPPTCQVFRSGQYYYLAMKQWKVKIRAKRERITISHADYKRLCAEMGK